MRLQRVASLEQDVDARGRTAIVTGGTDGIGRCLAHRLASRGARVVIAARDLRKCETVARELQRETGSATIECVRLDLSDLSSVRAAIAEINARLVRLDLLVCNAGANFSGTGSSRTETADGFESTAGVNHFGHAALTLGVAPMLRLDGGARVVMVASDVHKWARAGDLEDLDFRHGYSPGRAYGASKLANVLFARALAKREPVLEVYAAHPGAVDTKMLRRYFDRPALRWFLPLARRFALLTPDEAAAGLERVALMPDLGVPSGRYFERGVPAKASRVGRDDQRADRLWSATLARISAEVA